MSRFDMLYRGWRQYSYSLSIAIPFWNLLMANQYVKQNCMFYYVILSLPSSTVLKPALAGLVMKFGSKFGQKAFAQRLLTIFIVTAIYLGFFLHQKNLDLNGFGATTPSPLLLFLSS